LPTTSEAIASSTDSSSTATDSKTTSQPRLCSHSTTKALELSTNLHPTGSTTLHTLTEATAHLTAYGHVGCTRAAKTLSELLSTTSDLAA